MEFMKNLEQRDPIERYFPDRNENLSSPLQLSTYIWLQNGMRARNPSVSFPGV